MSVSLVAIFTILSRVIPIMGLSQALPLLIYPKIGFALCVA